MRANYNYRQGLQSQSSSAFGYGKPTNLQRLRRFRRHTDSHRSRGRSFLRVRSRRNDTLDEETQPVHVHLWHKCRTLPAGF